MNRFFLVATAVMTAATLSFAEYKDVISQVGWEGSQDAIGSKAEVVIDSTDEGVINSITAKITKAKSESYESYASLAAYYETDIAGSETIIVTYTSDKQVWFTLPMVGLTDENGTAHGTVLEAAENKTDTLAIEGFGQASWTEAADSVALDLSKVKSFSFEEEDAPADESTINIKISQVWVDGISWGDVDIAKSMKLNSVNKSVIAGFKNNAVTLSVPTSGNYQVSLLSANGRLIQTTSVELTAKTTKSISLQEQSSGVYFVKITGSNLNVTEKITIK